MAKIGEEKVQTIMKILSPRIIIESIYTKNIPALATQKTGQAI
ncbi:hypothetical protein [uncultured Dubosiella sp.]|nr:hypothetical protein [uncultured Dubosiella sp.]